MSDKQKYFDGERVCAEKIALDIRYRRISHNELMSLISDPKISAAFYEDSYKDKIPKSQWDEKYLEKLSYAVISESFNADYLLYLEEVAEFVTRNKEKKNSNKIVLGTVVILCIVLFFIICW